MAIFTEKQKIILGLSDKEKIVLESLVREKSIFMLSKDTKIPRATLYPIIENLYRRGFIEGIKYGNRFLYKTLPIENLSEKISQIGIELMNHKNKNNGNSQENINKNWLKKLLNKLN